MDLKKKLIGIGLLIIILVILFAFFKAIAKFIIIALAVVGVIAIVAKFRRR